MFLTRKTYPLIFMVVVGIIGVYFWHFQAIAESDWSYTEHEVPMTSQSFLSPMAKLPSPDISQKIAVVVTAYSSTPEETDDTPFITAANTSVRSGIIANNSLPFGTRVRLQELFGDTVLEVEDRMHWRKAGNQVDVWLPSKEEAICFGVKFTTMEILSN
ncbi:MAG: 3D domain-containing protein [Candidatus Pacebacteria bacterium]|nr:3D domain-containing protein [Candidatus Paceibacterota bacterium]